ncbi:MAG TPA: hypothetical protein PKV22_06450 [Paludibacteraceae bacterium]|jgi:hypothetical protein|nr:MAG: hypothetical protein BWX51_02118 [Bacteroidetes bacterium ADurb.Bin012]HNZ89362.1 hypothetical protein [Candidatus Cloacimonas acidaminovorans]HQF11889.1 hypothetical protein [Paludibacteraceae bacterium]
MNNYFKRRTPINNAPETLSPKKRKLLHDANLEELMKLYEKCYEERIPRCTLIDVIENEIYQKTLEKNQWRIDRGYRLEKFVPKKK